MAKKKRKLKFPKLECGCTYVNRLGYTERVIRRPDVDDRSWDEYPFQSPDSNRTYTERGEYVKGAKTGNDLIIELNLPCTCT